MQNGDFRTRITSLYGSQTSSVVFAFKTATLWTRIKVSMGPRLSSVDLWMQNSVLRSRMTLVYWFPAFICGFVHSKQRDFNTRITVSYGSQTSPVVLCIQNNVTLASELLVLSMGPSPHLWFLHAKQRHFRPELQVSMGPRPHLFFCENVL